MSACTTSPARTLVEGLAGLPLTRTWPASHSWVAMGLDLTRRTAHNQRSIRVSSGIGCSRAAPCDSVAFTNEACSVGRSVIIIVPHRDQQVRATRRHGLPDRGSSSYAGRPKTRREDRRGAPPISSETVPMTRLRAAIAVMVLVASTLIPTVGVSATPNPTSVTIAGSLQSEAGCPGDWDPTCATTHLTFDTADDVWQGTFALPAGAYEYKAEINDAWDENY